MRIERFELTRYGAFTDHIINFGSGGKPCDFHIIYGPNEAGKSTLRDAVIDFLYGFPRQTTYNFIHANDALQIAAALTVGDAKHRFVRVKRNKTSLLTPDNQPASEDVVKSALGDINRASYANMFSLDEDTLEQGGEGILRSEGDLGELLFAAASGLSSLSSALDEIRAEAANFYKKPGRSHRLADTKKRLGELRSEIRERDVQASAYDALVKDEQAQRERHEAAKAERDEQVTRATQTRMLLDCADPWREYQELSGDLAAIQDAPDLPEGWQDEAERLSRESAAAKTTFEESERVVKRAKSARSAIKVDSSILSLGARIERLVKDDNEAKYRTSKDISSRQRELATVEDDLRGMLRRLGAQKTDDPESLLIPAATVGRIKELIEPLSGIEADERTAREEVERTEEKLKQAKTALATFTDSVDLTNLMECLATVRDDGDDRERTQLDKRCSELDDDLSAALEALMPWQGAAGDLFSLPILDKTVIENLRGEDADIQESLVALAREADRLQDEQARLSAEFDTEVATAGVIEDAVAHEVRAARDSAWQDHRKTFKDGRVAVAKDIESTAVAFEAAIVDDDRVTGARFFQSTEIAALRKLKTDLARCEAEIRRTDEKRDAVESKQTTLMKRIAQVMTTLTLPEDMAIGSVEQWQERRDSALVKRRELEKAEIERKQLTDRIDAAMEALAVAMTQAGIDPQDLDWRTRVNRCDQAILAWRDEEARKLAAEAVVKDAKVEIAARKRRRTKAKGAIDSWRTSWTAALETCWIGANGRQATPAEAKEILETLDDLAIKLDKARDLKTRIEAMQANRDAYGAEVAALAADAAAAFDPKDPLKTADWLRDQLAEARENERRHKEKTEELAEAEDRLKDAEVATARIGARFAEMVAVFPAKDFETLLAGMRRAEQKASLQEQIRNRRRHLKSRLGVADFGGAEKLLTEQLSGPEALATIQDEYDALIAGIDDVNAHVSSLFHDWKKAETALATIGDDAAVARLEEERRVLLLDIGAEAERYMTLSAGTMIVSRALSTYLDTHRSSMMERASEAFSSITRGAFSSLAAMPGKDREVLVGVRRNGSSIIASQMSRATRFQLYLALRIAGYKEFVKHREPLPFFADDILETFDDDRSAETFSLMASMAKDGQVIYLTHHRHLCEIAREVCADSVMVHELPDLVAP